MGRYGVKESRRLHLKDYSIDQAIAYHPLCNQGMGSLSYSFLYLMIADFIEDLGMIISDDRNTLDYL